VEIELRASLLGAKMWCFYYRQHLPPSGKLPVLNLQWPKISIFAPMGRLLAPLHVKFGMAEGHALRHAKFHANRCPRVGTRPQKMAKISTFGKESPAGANTNFSVHL